MSPVLERCEYIPASYNVVSQPVPSMQADVTVVSDLQPHERLIPLWELSVNGMQVAPACPVAIRLRYEDGMFHAENDALSVYGAGVSPEDAIRDFKETASMFASEYRELAADAVVGLGAKVRDNFLRAFPI